MSTQTYPNHTLTSEQFIRLAKFAPYLVVDTEGYDTLGFALAYNCPGFGIIADYFPIAHHCYPHDNVGVDIWEALKDLLENHPRLVGHNMKFDIKKLRMLDIHCEGPYHDTMLMAHMLNENLISKDLDFVSKHYGGQPKQRPEKMQSIIKVAGWEYVPIYMMREYSAHDAFIEAELYETILPLWEEEGYAGHIWENREAPFGRLVGESIEQWGIRIDADHCIHQISVGESRMAELIRGLGYRNPASSKDLHELLIDDLGLPVHHVSDKTGKPSFDKKAMEFYDELLESRNDPTAQQILEYRGWAKTVSSNYRAYLKFLDEDGRIRPSYKLHGTVTGRMSCLEPNLQQIPRISDKPWNGHLKAAFIPDEGYNLWEIDYSNLELRLAAVYADERTLLAAFEAGVDIFQYIADELGWQRQKVKTFIYATMYGAGIAKIASSMGVSIQEATRLKAMFYSRYRGLEARIREAAQKARQRGYVALWTGRRRHFEDPRGESHKAFNAVIQGGGAEIVKSAMLRIHDRQLNNNDSRMLLQVHDSVVFEIKSGMESYYLPRIEEAMQDVEQIFKKCVFPVKSKIWGSD